MDDEPCGLDPLTCGATDPVSEPAYNMRQVIKQCILLEEHLVERAKFCRDCIIKHFLHIIGLLEEAEMMAPGGFVDDYPMLLEGDRLFQEQMDKWLQGEADYFESPDDEARRKFRLSIAATVREYRKALVVVYYPPGGLGPNLPHFKLRADKKVTSPS